MAAIRLVNPYDESTWEKLITELLIPNMECSADYQDISLYLQVTRGVAPRDHAFPRDATPTVFMMRSEEHTSELQSLMRISYAVFCLKKTTTNNNTTKQT